MRGGQANPINDRYRIPKPKNLKQVPHYLKELIRTFLTRLFYIFRLVWEAKRSLFFIMLFMSVFNGVMPVISSLVAAQILNELALVYSGVELAFGVIAVLLVCQFVLMFINSAVSRIYSMFTNISGEVVSNHVKKKIMTKAKTIDLMCYDSPDFYARMENANREAGSRPLQIMSSTLSILSTLISIVSYTVILFAVNAWAPLLIVLVALPSTAINFVYRRKNAEYMFKRSKNRRQMDYYSSTLVNKDLAKEIRMFGLADSFIEKYQQTFESYFTGLKKLQRDECIWNLAATILTNAVYCCLYIFLAKAVFEGRIEIGSFSLYTGAINSIGSGVGVLISTTAAIYEGTLFINNLISFLDEKPTIVPSVTPAQPVIRHQGHTIEFRDVSFHYPGSSKEVLKHINLTIHPGETVVIVGLNGAGKTTLVKLLTRLYDPTEGCILLDGKDIRSYDVEQLYALFGIIFQDFGKYAVSAGENIAFGDVCKDRSGDGISLAAQRSGADQFIRDLPQQYDTPLMRYFEDSGAELSIGQWQKLSIARAFYSDSDILILDEPTASLDPLAEQEIFNQFNNLRENKTSIFISHRLSSATIADTIFVMENGQIVERGNHSVLMSRQGRYYQLFTTQAERYLSTP